MTWTKLDDGFCDNPKVEEIGNEAAGAYCRMLAHCGQQLTEGHVSDRKARYVARPAVLAKLVEYGFIQRNGKGWLIPDYLDFNPTAAEAKAKRKAKQTAGKLGGVASGKARSKP